MGLALITIVILLVVLFAVGNNKKKLKPPSQNPAVPKPTQETVKIQLDWIQNAEPKVEYRPSPTKDETIIDVTGLSVKLETYTEKTAVAGQDQKFEPKQPLTYVTAAANNYYNPDDYKLGNLYKDKLNLNKQEVSWLNRFWNPNNVFLSVEGCCVETINLYLSLIKTLNRDLANGGTTLAKEVEALKEFATAGFTEEKPYHYYELHYAKDQVESEIYQTAFKRAERTLREAWGHKRKVAGEFSSFNPDLIKEFETRLGGKIDNICSELAKSIQAPDRTTELELNALNVNRWKQSFDVIVSAFTTGTEKEFAANIDQLAELNNKNPSLEHIYFEASKFIAKHDRLQALRFYLHYLDADLRSANVDQKQLTKTIQKSLFTTNEQLHEFQKIIAGFVVHKDLKKSLEALNGFYAPKRKTIQLDRNAIKTAQQEYSGAVELLNEYLQDEYEDEKSTIKSVEVNVDEVQINITPKSYASPFTSDVNFSVVQIEVVELFANKNFSVSQTTLDDFAKSKNVFKNQLLDSVNEVCYELLEDVLIEEDETVYVMNESYYHKLLVTA